MTYIDQFFNLSGKTVVITGSNGQVGKEFCKSFMESGCTVIGLDENIHSNKIDGVKYKSFDVRERDIVNRTMYEIVMAESKIDCIINNAGVTTFDNFLDRTEDEFNKVVDVNLKGSFWMIQSYVEIYDKFKFKTGSIINISSIFGVVSPDFRNYIDLDRHSPEVYGATKAGLIQMTKYFCVHLANRNIRVNSISPGGIFNLENPQGEEFVKSYSYRTPMKRMAKSDDVTGAALFLASDASTYISGQNIVIDGGLTAW